MTASLLLALLATPALADDEPAADAPSVELGTPDIEIDEERLDFGEARSPKKKSVTIRNDGTLALRVTEVLVPDPHFQVDLSQIPSTWDRARRRTSTSPTCRAPRPCPRR